MDASEVEHERGGGDERRNTLLIERVTVEQTQFVHGCGRLFGGNTFETNFRCAAGNKFNDVIIHALELSGVATGLLAERVKMFQCFRRDGNACSFGMNFIQCEPIAENFFFRTAARAGMAEHKRTQTVAFDRDAFDTIGRFRALDNSRVAQRLQNLRRLTCLKLLLSFGLGNVRQQAGGARRQGHVAEPVIAE